MTVPLPLPLPPSDALLKASKVYALLQDGLERMLSVVKSDEFEVVVKGERFTTTLAEAVLISPKVYELLQTDPTIRTFTICGIDEGESEDLDSGSFKAFLDCVHSRVFQDISPSNELSFLTICRLLGNERLAFLFLASLNSLSPSPSGSSSSSSSSSTSSSGVSISSGVLMTLLSSPDAIIDYCASEFHRYSIDEIRRLGKHTLHRLLGSRSLRIGSEDQFMQFLIELGSDYFEFWQYIEPIFLTTDGLSLFKDTLPFEYVNEWIWDKIFYRIANKPDESIRIHRFLNSIPSVQRPESNILDDIPSILKSFASKPWRLLYRGTRDGFGSSTFHSKCDQQSNTLTIILTTTGYVFGGFTPIAWEGPSGGTYKADNTGKSFLFSLKNPRNTEPKTFPLSNPAHAICCNRSFGPVFGGGNEICVANNCDQGANSSTNFRDYYRNDIGIAGDQVLAGQKMFQVKEIEVFSISS
jgi:hypothetical protein